ncbi:transglycosylase SLT domain-containing protein [Pleionea sp. CnH1-48]|uniref:transglycosylase SLT domain-containing protein n=1 Tax=Pleionea sp. CnH1-48 TaxID=2954494 RepID=UPI002097C2DA|nr:transglycosylase SLT domain-containing protein [Pleionea sp. CnH1-48]MCO7227210.1 transglycosylase SLT domain-containing protein [Pleionea sp. CnH1-48]
MRKYTPSLFALLLCASLSSGVAADPTAAPVPSLLPTPIASQQSDKLKAQRAQFKQALKALKKGQIKSFRRHQSQLEDYVLHPYLQQSYLLKRINLKHRLEIKEFLDTYKNAAVTVPIRFRFLRMLARKKQTALFLTYYQPTSDINLQCHWLNFRLKTNEQRNDIFTQAKRLWLHGKSRPKSCDPVFKALIDNKELNDDLVWQRMILAAKARQSGLIRYLTSLLSKERQNSGSHLLKSVRRPEHLTNLHKSNIPTEDMGQIAASTLSKLVWRDKDRALKLLDKISSKIQFTYEQKKIIARHFALSLATSGHQRAGEWLENIPPHEQDDKLIRWKLVNDLRQLDWQQVNNWVKRTPAPKDDESSWLYWRGRSESQLGQNQLTQNTFDQLSRKRNYYGFLASAHIDQAPSLESKTFHFEPLLLTALKQSEGLQRAKELYLIDRKIDARREWYRFKRQRSFEEQKHLAVIAHEWGWHNQAIISLAETRLFDAVDMRFPIAYQELMKNASKQKQLDMSWSLAIARRESAFMPDARSRVGALGLMQLMPQTARYVAKKERVKLHSTRQLLNPELNIKLGTSYLKRLLDEHEGNNILATASYNAGKHRVKKWIALDQEIPTDVWIETIPYHETRAYIKNVLAYQQIYTRILGSDDNLFKQIVGSTIGNAEPKQSP